MAFENSKTIITLEAAADLSGKQYYFVAVDANGKAALTGNNGNPIGVLQNKPAAGEAASICVYGVTKVYVGTHTGIGTGYNIGCDANSAAKVSASGAFRLGVSLEDPTANGDIISLLFQKNGLQA